MRIEVNPERLAAKILKRLMEKQKGYLVVTATLRTHYDPVTRTIYWRPRDGFFTLLHEAAHCALGHADSLEIGFRLVQESEAWIWSEEACHLWGLPFNYKRADRYFASYASHVPGGKHWTVGWRHRDA
mgnify:FL=1